MKWYIIILIYINQWQPTIFYTFSIMPPTFGIINLADIMLQCILVNIFFIVVFLYQNLDPATVYIQTILYKLMFKNINLIKSFHTWENYYFIINSLNRGASTISLSGSIQWNMCCIRDLRRKIRNLEIEAAELSQRLNMLLVIS